MASWVSLPEDRWLVSEGGLAADKGSTIADRLAGSAAAAFQSTYGATLAFRGLQSAAMSGYGAAAVNGAMQGSYALGVVLTEKFKQRRDSEKPVARSRL